MFTTILLIAIIVILVLVLFNVAISQKSLNILFLVIAALVVLSTTGWQLNLR